MILLSFWWTIYSLDPSTCYLSYWIHSYFSTVFNFFKVQNPQNNQPHMHLLKWKWIEHFNTKDFSIFSRSNLISCWEANFCSKTSIEDNVMPLPKAFVVWSAMTAALQGMSKLMSHRTIRTFFSTSGSTFRVSGDSLTIMLGAIRSVAAFGVGVELMLVVATSALFSCFGPSMIIEILS